jgi:hypothetical protein
LEYDSRRVFEKLPSHIAGILFEIADRAADHCSQENYGRDKDMLESLKRAGLQIVPVNRAAFAEAGWLYGLTFSTGGASTIDDVDRIVKMGPKPLPKRLPSQAAKSNRRRGAQILKWAAERNAVRREAEKELASLTRMSAGADSLDVIWSHEREGILSELASRPALTLESAQVKGDATHKSTADGAPILADPSLLMFLVTEGERYIASNPQNCTSFCRSGWFSSLASAAARMGDTGKMSALLQKAWKEEPSVYLAIEASMLGAAEAEHWLEEAEAGLSTTEVSGLKVEALGLIDFSTLIEHYRKAGRPADMERVLALAERKALEAGVEHQLAGVYMSALKPDRAAAVYAQRVRSAGKAQDIARWPSSRPAPAESALVRMVAPAIVPPVLRVAAAARSAGAPEDAVASADPLWIEIATRACSMAVASKDMALLKACETALAPALLSDRNVAAEYMMRDIIEAYWTSGDKDRARKRDPVHAGKLERHDQMEEAVARRDWTAAFAAAKKTQFPDLSTADIWRSVGAENDPDLVRRLLAKETDDATRPAAIRTILRGLVKPRL